MKSGFPLELLIQTIFKEINKMNTTTKVTLIIMLFAAITIFVLFVSGMLTGTMDNRWMMGR